MERVHYRRYTPSKLHSYRQPQPISDHNLQQHVQPEQPPKPERIGFREKLIVQCIISGIILAVVLAISMVHNPQIISIRNGLNQAISEHITVEQVAAEVHRLLGNEHQVFFINELALEPYIDEPVYEEPFGEEPVYIEPIPGFEAEAPSEGQITTPRIDEDILREIFGYSEGDDLQTTAPEPIILPEL